MLLIKRPTKSVAFIVLLPCNKPRKTCRRYFYVPSIIQTCIRFRSILRLTSTDRPKDDVCPFCQSPLTPPKKMLKPWGFAPLNHTSIPEAWAEVEYSYAEEPCYFAEPTQHDMKDIGCAHLKVAKRPDKITIINKGIQGHGFYICRKCGAAEVIQPELTSKKVNKNQNDTPAIPLKGVGRPYSAPGLSICQHSPETAI